MFAIIWRALKDRKVSLIIYMTAAVLFMWMYVAMFPAMREQSEVFSKAFESFPDALFKAFGIDDLNMSTIESFLALEHFSIVWPLMAIFLLVAIAGRGLAGQIEDGTIEVTLQCPVSRLQLFFAKYLVGLISLLVFTIFSIFSIIPLAALHKIDYAISNFMSVAVLSFLFGWAVLSVAMLFSSIFSEKGRVYMAIGGILLVMYVLNIAASINDSLDGLKYASFFNYYDYNGALIKNSLNGTAVGVFIITAVICTAASSLIYQKRDICT